MAATIVSCPSTVGSTISLGSYATSPEFIVRNRTAKTNLVIDPVVTQAEE